MNPSQRTTGTSFPRLCWLILAAMTVVLAVPPVAKATETVCVKKEEEQCVGEDGDKVEGDCDVDTCATCSGECKDKCVEEEEKQVQIDTDDQGNPVYDPVLPGNGAFAEGGIDMTIERGGLMLQARRSYNSKSDAGDLGLGHNWDHTLLSHIEDLGSEGVVLYKGGGAIRIELDNGEYQTDGKFELEKVSGKFELTQPNGFKYYFDNNHNIISKVSPQGPYYNWVYDSNQNVTTIQYKESTDVLYTEWDDTNHRLTKITDVQGGATVEYQYSAASDLTKITGSCGSCSGSSPEGFGYDAFHRITAMYNADGQKLHDNQYDSAARVTKQVYQASPEKAYVYDYSQFASGILKITKPDGVQNEYHMDSQNQGTKVVVKNNGIQGSDVDVEQYFDDNGRLTRHVHGNGFDQRFHYNADGRMTMAVRYDATNPLTISQYVYDADGRAITHIDAEGTVTAYHYDTNGTGRLTQKVVDPGGLALTESWVYDTASGLAITRTSPDGTATAFAYDGNGYRTKQVIDPTGLALTTSYLVDAAGRVTKRIDPRGSEWVRLYNGAGKVTKQVDPSGRTVLRDYDNANRLVTKTVQDAETSPAITRVTTYHYDRYGNLTRQTEPGGSGGRHTDFAYDFLHRRVSMTRPTGEQFAYEYNELGKLYQEKAYDGSSWITRATYLYDGDKQITRHTDANGNVVVANAYDSYNRLTRETDALGHYTIYEHDGAGRNTRQVFHDSAGSEQAETRLAYDAAGRMTSQRRLADPGGSTSNADPLVEVAYDDAGRVLTRTTYLAGSTTAQQTISYDAAGRMTSQAQDDGPTVAMDYDDGGNVLTRTVDPGAGNLQLATIFAYDAAGRRTRQTRPDLTYAVTLYDGLGRVTLSAQYDSGDSVFAATGRLYDDALNVATKVYQVDDPGAGFAYSSTDDPAQVMLYAATGRLTAQQDAGGNQTDFAYDDLGRRITTTDPVGNQQIVVYDDGDRVLTRIQRDYDGTSYTAFTTAMHYDAANRLTRSVQQGPDGDIAAAADNLIATRWYDALGRVTQTEDPAGMQTARYYDDVGNVTRLEEDAGAGGIGRITDKAYDRAGRLTRLTAFKDSSSGTGIEYTDYLYSDAGVTTRVIYPDDTTLGGPDRGYVEFFYDAALRLTREVDQAGLATDTVYDDMGRRLTVTKGAEVDSFTYTDWGAIASAKRGTSSNHDASSSVTRSYNGLMRLTRESQAIEEDPARHVDYAYDLPGNVTQLNYPGGTTIATTYDANHRRDVIDKDASQIADYDYVGPGNRPRKLTFETGVTDVVQSHRYDGAGRLTRLSQAQGGTELATFGYTFDNAGNILTRTFEHRDSGGGAPSEEYAHDSLHRLTKTTFGQRSSTPYKGWTYDDLGNHLTQDDDGATTAGLYNAVNEQTARGGTALTWSRTGNLTEDDAGYDYAYDRDNMLTRVEDASNNLVEQYTYDALGRRIVAGDGTNDKRFYYSIRFQILEQTDGSDVVQKAFVWGNYIDELLLMEDTAGDGGTAGADCFALRHHNYNVVALIDDDGTVVERYDYNPYGQRFVLDADFTDDADGASDYLNPIGHQGLHHDAETGLVYNRARMLHPTLGRFMQRDPLGYVDGMSVYEYLKSQVTKYSDAGGTSIAPANPIPPGNIVLKAGYALVSKHAICNDCAASMPACCEGKAWQPSQPYTWTTGLTLVYDPRWWVPSWTPMVFGGSYLPSCACDTDGNIWAEIAAPWSKGTMPSGTPPMQMVWVRCT